MIARMSGVKKGFGSAGEHALQARCGTSERAQAFYQQQMRSSLNPAMRKFLARMELMFVSTADSHGECDCSVRAGQPGFVCVLDDRTVAYPEFRGNGVMASLGNITENGHVGLLFVDFLRNTVGMHINGRARVVENEELLHRPELPAAVRAAATAESPRVERWVLVEIEEAYIHCSKHLPRFKKVPKEIHWGTDSKRHKGGDFFRVHTA